ncbi:MAG: hypothetical protein IJ083_16560 [Clostridia bacterium]|nr:hypothetical protein [Clostridia bacterium]
MQPSTQRLSFWGRVKERITHAPWRFIIGLGIIFAAFILLTVFLANLQLRDSDIYAERAESGRTKKIVLRGKRGNILDADSVILAEDRLIYNVTFYKDVSLSSKSNYQTFTRSILDAIEIIERNGGEMAISFNIQRSEETGEWEFNFGDPERLSASVLETRERQWRSNNYVTATRYPTANDCMEKLYDRYQFAVVAPNLDEETMLKVMAIYCEMQMNVFSSQPIVIAKDVNYETVIEVETKSMMLSGMEIAIGTKRVYPRSNLAAQVIGYIGAIPTQAMWRTLSAKGYSYNDLIGRDGIESSMEDWLTQNSSTKQGYRIVERDQLSKVIRELDYEEPQDGNNVKLTLHASYQQVAERAIAENVLDTRIVQETKLVDEGWLEDNKEDIAVRDWEKYPLQLAEHGCLVVLDMEDRVLAMANYPTYDLNALVSGGADAITILQDPRNLLLNYGIHARGTPGSIFKMVTGYGALNEGELGPTELISDMGYFKNYNSDESTAPKCWISPNYRYKHANQTIIEGLTHSCNYFFYELGSRLGEERLYRYAAQFGLTSRTGIDLPGEVRSVVGCQNTLFDPTKPMNEANQDTSLPIIVFNAIKKHLREQGLSRNIYYDDDRLSVCTTSLMNMAVNTGQNDWLPKMRSILMEELGMTKEMVYTRVIISDTYNYLNTIKWGGSQTIMTAIGQSVTVLTPVAVARYVCTIANGGYVYNLSLVDSITSPEGEILSQRAPKLVNKLENTDIYFPLIKEGMKGVVDEQDGTAGKYFKGWKYRDDIAAKTGSAQTTAIDLENNGWFVAYAPFDNPEVALAVFIPNGLSGGNASVAAREFLTWYLDQKNLRTVDYDLPIGNTLAP